MAIGSGLAGSVGMTKETTWGTRAVPTTFYEFDSEGGVRNQNFLQSRMIRSGRTFQSAPRSIPTTRDAAFSIAGQVPIKTFGQIVDLLHGNTVTPVQSGATTAYVQTHNIGASDPTKSATWQAGKPDTSGTVRCFEYTGSMVNAFTMSCAVDGWLEFTAGFDSADEDTAQTLATPSYSTLLEGFHFQQCAVSVNGVVQNGTTGVIPKNLSLDLSMPRANQRFGLRSTATKAKPIANDYNTGAGSLTMEFSDMVQYGLYTAGSKVPISYTFTSSTLAGTAVPYALSVTMASCQFRGTTPQVSSFDILPIECPFDILDDATNPPVAISITEVRTTAL